MNESAQPNAKELSDTSVKDTNKLESSKSQIIEEEQLGETPFTCVKFDEEYFVTLGNYRITEKYKDKQSAINEALNPTWDMMVRVMEIVFMIQRKHEENLKDKNK